MYLHQVVDEIFQAELLRQNGNIASALSTLRSLAFDLKTYGWFVSVVDRGFTFRLKLKASDYLQTFQSKIKGTIFDNQALTMAPAIFLATFKVFKAHIFDGSNVNHFCFNIH